MRLTNKQSKGVDTHIIKAVEVLGPTSKPREIWQFLRENRQAKYLTQYLFYSRLSRLKKAGRVTCQNGCRSADQMEEWRSSIANIVLGQTRQLGVRGVFYLAVAAGLCEKNEGAYQSVCNALDTLRMSGEVEFSSIIDPGRTIHPFGLVLQRSPVLDLVTSRADYEEIQTYIESSRGRGSRSGSRGSTSRRGQSITRRESRTTSPMLSWVRTRRKRRLTMDRGTDARKSHL